MSIWEGVLRIHAINGLRKKFVTDWKSGLLFGVILGAVPGAIVGGIVGFAALGSMGILQGALVGASFFGAIKATQEAIRGAMFGKKQNEEEISLAREARNAAEMAYERGLAEGRQMNSYNPDHGVPHSITQATLQKDLEPRR